MIDFIVNIAVMALAMLIVAIIIVSRVKKKLEYDEAVSMGLFDQDKFVAGILAIVVTVGTFILLGMPVAAMSMTGDMSYIEAVKTLGEVLSGIVLVVLTYYFTKR